MAPLLLLFLLGALCALFSLTSSSRNSTKKCDGGGSHGKCGDDGQSRAKNGSEQEQGQDRKVRPDPEADLGIVFSTFDHDGDGFITAVELQESLRRLGIAVSADESKAMVARVDANSDGLIDIPEFRELYDSIPKKRKPQQPAEAEKFAAGDGGSAPMVENEEEAEEEEEEERDLREAFDVFDGNKDGLISAEELGTVLGSLGLRQHGASRPAVAECRDMIRLVDSDGDGMVSFEEFKRMMTVVKA
ncbi:probable calcium-binding protein CML30 [Phragmites australis]|uniref:probable calcium-binding protein CML30 n=1 Tax=Phragmites australis TaxID=29695 RepID=UPI002D76E3FA|nr:probable calcium-binding protein CML30 [Phragmites australis]